MPNIKIEDVSENKKKINFVVTLEEAQPYLDEAATRISKQQSIKGFRPGKAGYDVVKQHVGEMKILEEAIEVIVRKSYIEALLANDIDTVGSPKIDVEKLAPDNDIVFSAEVALMPSVKELGDYNKLKVEAKTPKVEDKEVELSLRDLQRMQTKEVRATADDVVGETEKLVVSMDMKKDGVPVEGGQSPNHVIFLTEDYYIPGFKDEVKGMKEGEERTFTLTFPEDHAQKMLAGNQIEFIITLKELFHLEPPEINDGFAATLGMKDFNELKTRIKENLLAEKQQEELARQERDMLELLSKKSTYDEIPDLLVNEEINKMLAELQRAVEAQGARACIDRGVSRDCRHVHQLVHSALLRFRRTRSKRPSLGGVAHAACRYRRPHLAGRRMAVRQGAPVAHDYGGDDGLRARDVLVHHTGHSIESDRRRHAHGRGWVGYGLVPGVERQSDHGQLHPRQARNGRRGDDVVAQPRNRVERGDHGGVVFSPTSGEIWRTGCR